MTFTTAVPAGGWTDKRVTILPAGWETAAVPEKPTPKQPVDTGRELGNEVVKALGLEGQSVKSIDLHMGVGDLLTANVVVFVRKDAADRLAKIFAKQVTLEAKVVGEKLVDE
jgi:hypothetical protein